VSLRRRTKERRETEVLDRLLGVRNGLDLRAAGRVMSALEREGLVEISGRQGVFVVGKEPTGGFLPEGPRWMVDVLKSAWSRGIAVRMECRFSTGKLDHSIADRLSDIE
jgi:DNA-binding FadR family transcriptional regulator